MNSTVDATAANGVITFTGKGPEGGTDYTFSVSTTYDTGHFSHSSFSGTSGSLANGVSSQTAFYSFTIPSAGGFAPNGNILAANGTVNGNWVYTYDSFNRLSSAVATAKGLGCGWVYDRYGNRWQQNPYTGACGSDQRTYTMNGANTNNNRIDGASYDALGNLLVNPSGGGSYVYDAESRLISAGGLKYIYDAEGRRVAKLSGTTVMNEYLFDTEGNQQIELNGSGTVLHTNLYAGGKLIATYNGTDTYFHFTDWLGTRRYEANSAGAMAETCTNLPFGDSQSCTGALDATEHHFTGKERDTESGLDQFGARYYASGLGRFITPDWAAKPTTVPYATFGNPQTLNLYGYVGSNPTTILDPDGHCPDGMDVCFMPKLAKDANYMTGVRKGAAQGAAAFAVVAALAGAAEAGGGVLLRNLLGIGLATAPRTVPIIADAIEGLTPGPAGSLTISGATRLSEQEISTGVRLASQTGKALAESAHIGEEFVDSAGKTYDAMGGGKAFGHFGDGTKFFDSIVSHLNKSVDHVVIDLQGASKSQIDAIKNFVGSLSDSQQQKILYAK